MSGKGEKSGRRPRRPLTADELALWSSVIRSTVPLGPAKREDSGSNASGVDGAPPAERRPPASQRAGVERAKPPAPQAPPLAPFDRRLKQRLARGRATIDARIDLHGLTQAEAHDALARFLRTAQAEGARFVLIITGKGGREGGLERGVLRRQVPLWLKSPQLRPFVVGFEAAHFGHGGEGALYVRIRRTARQSVPE